MLIGSQIARFNTAPSPRGYSMVHADRALEFAEGYNHIADPWQAEAVRAWLRTDDSGWCSSTWGLSVPRQNGKNGALEIVELYLMVALNLKILHTSHLLSSARKAFKRLMHFFGTKVNDPYAKFPELNALVKEIRKTNGQEAIELINGGLIEVGARTGGAGRGSSFDVLVVDEGQEYEEDEQEALEPTTSASPSGDPVIIYMGTPPRYLSDRGAPFVRVRNAAITGADKRSAWVEHSPAGDVDKMDEQELRIFTADRKNWSDGNPALGGRIKLRTVEGEQFRMSPRSFARERLNMWPTPSDIGKLAFTPQKWDELAIENPDAEWPLAAIGVDMNPERTKVSIGVATFSDTGGVHLELAADAPFDEAGTTALVDWLWTRAKRRIPVVVDAYSPARPIIEAALKNKQMLVRILDANEYSQACVMLREAVERHPAITHFGQEHLDHSAKNTVQDQIKNRPGSFKWNRLSLDVDLSPIVSITCAHFGALKFAKRRRQASERKQRHAIVG
ncbi:hypothetical protein E5206_09445 [Arthrobacter sp. PAMC25564]|uniref:hypothetical protein n=1 Tax=Arthrobacter sp. PAMC25564 TaxID=2565366 RepID=UPI0010A2341E|nr:hypothetical protein [Arthrobacter sp. PAMC25564]QCB97128.1 hypothetical protein E5206_09445 [Arthrobacter sp. PAMC25564]